MQQKIKKTQVNFEIHMGHIHMANVAHSRETRKIPRNSIFDEIRKIQEQ